MIVCKTFFKIIKKYKAMIFLYTIILIVFGGIQLQTGDSGITFVDEKPDILIINRDENIGITKNLIEYLHQNCNIVHIKQTEEKINDALFYRDVNYIIYIKKDYRKEILQGKNPQIDIKKVNNYQASLAERILTKYIKIQNIYAKNSTDEKEIIQNINASLEKDIEVEITSKIEKSKTEQRKQYFNFASYSLMAIILFIICFILSTFQNENIRKKIIISSTSYKTHTKMIRKASLLYILAIWILFGLLGVILLKKTMFTPQGMLYMINALLFCVCSLTLAMLISTLTHNKEAISGIVNVVALGSAFLCGAFVPVSWLPKNVVTIAHALPSYWYIHTNELLQNIETIHLKEIKPVIQNMIVLLLFTFAFIQIQNYIQKRKQKIG